MGTPPPNRCLRPSQQLKWPKVGGWGSWVGPPCGTGWGGGARGPRYPPGPRGGLEGTLHLNPVHAPWMEFRGFCPLSPQNLSQGLSGCWEWPLGGRRGSPWAESFSRRSATSRHTLLMTRCPSTAGRVGAKRKWDSSTLSRREDAGSTRRRRYASRSGAAGKRPGLTPPAGTPFA